MPNRKSNDQPELHVVDEEVPAEDEVVRLVKQDDETTRVQQRETLRDDAEVHHLPAPEKNLKSPEQGIEALDAQPIQADADFNPENAWEEPGDEKLAVPYGWFVLILLMLGTIIFFSIHHSPEEDSAAQITSRATIERLEEDEADDSEAGKIIEQVESTVRQYLNARSVDEMLTHVRDRQRVEPLMRDYYRSHHLPRHSFSRMTGFQPNIVNGDLFHVIKAELAGSDAEKSLLLEQLENGTFVVDWETDVVLQPMPWDDYAAQRPMGTSMVFRVHAELDSQGLYTHEFQDESKWLSFLLTAPDSEEFLFGYVRRDQPEAEKMLYYLISNRWKPRSMCLRLSLPEGTRSLRGVIIEEVVSSHWLIQ